MVRKIVLALLGSAAVACGGDAPTPITEDRTGPTPWKAFDLASLSAQRAGNGQNWLEFLDEASLSMGLYHLPAGAQDNQTPHGEDEIYYIASGSGQLDIGGVDHPVEAGSVFFVRAGLAHTFHSITEDLDVLVVFRSGAASQSPDGLAYPLSTITAPRQAGTNVWNLFLEAPSMSVGMYMLPQSVGGDSELTHTFDEINFVVSGRGRFNVGADRMDVGPGSIVFVERGAGHWFDALTDDLDVLILWER